MKGEKTKISDETKGNEMDKMHEIDSKDTNEVNGIHKVKVEYQWACIGEILDEEKSLKSLKNYNLTPEEQLEQDMFLKENLEKGYI
jgi:hypothetical protein